MAELSSIDVNEVRFLIKRLIKGGYDKKVPVRPSEQEILTSFESSLLVVEHLAKCGDEIQERKSSIQKETEFVQDAILDMCSSLQPMFSISTETADITNLATEFQDLFLSLKTHQQDHDDLDELNQAIDSDEEARLFEELDALMEAQERAEIFKGNVHELMAQSFQKVSRKLVELETAFDLVRISLSSELHNKS